MADRYVSTGGNDANNGLPRNTPFATIQKGVDDLQNIGGTVMLMVDGGITVYRQNVRMIGPAYDRIAIVGEPRVANPDPEFPNLQGCDAKPIIRGGNAPSPLVLIDGVTGAALKNLTIEHGKRTPDGAGILVKATRTFRVVDCCVRRNRADQHGGGMAMVGVTAAIVVDCKFERNVALNGGGIYMEHGRLHRRVGVAYDLHAQPSDR